MTCKKRNFGHSHIQSEDINIEGEDDYQLRRETLEETNTPVSRSWPPELYNKNLCSFKPPSLWSSVLPTPANYCTMPSTRL